MTPYYDHNNVTIYHGDCREILPTITADLVLTDPPYGVNIKYASYNDSPDNLKQLVSSFIPLITRFTRVALTPGQANLWLYPKPTWVLCWVTMAGTGSGPWGYSCWQPILVYGQDPYLQNQLGRRPDTFEHTETSTKLGHPCSKPLGVWKRVLERCSIAQTDIVVDPFMGAGTTLRAAKDSQRKCIGIEIDEQYCEISARRMSQEVLQF
jgi:DNA modification methylase